MKKRFLLSVMVMAILLPMAVMFAGCGTKKTHTVSISVKDNPTNNWVQLKFATDTEGSSVNVEHGEEAVLDVLVRDYLDETTLKIYNGDDELTLTREQGLTPPTQYDGSFRKIGTIEVGKIKKDVKLECTITERVFKFSFAKAETEAIGAEKQTILSDLVLDDDKSLYYALTTTNYIYQTTYEQAVNEGIRLTSQHPIGYYDLTSLGLGVGSVTDAGVNKYLITVPETLALENSLTINANSVKVSKLCVVSGSGSVIGFQKNSETTMLTSVEFNAGETASVKVVLNSELGASLTGAQVFVNGTKLTESASGYSFDISLDKMPVHYGSEGDMYTYEVTVQGVEIDMTSDEFCKVVGADGAMVNTTNDGLYFYDKTSNTAYYKNLGGSQTIEVSTAKDCKISLGSQVWNVKISDLVNNDVLAQLLTTDGVDVTARFAELYAGLLTSGGAVKLYALDDNQDGAITLDEINLLCIQLPYTSNTYTIN